MQVIPASDPWRVRFIRRSIAFSDAVSRTPSAVILGALVFLSLLRSGFVIWNWFELSPRLLTQWGEPDNPFQSNVVFNALGSAWRAFAGEPDGPAWLIVQCLLAIVGITIVVAIVHRKTWPTSRYLATAMVLSSGIAAVFWREIGRYDFIFLIAITIAFLSQRRWLIWTSLAIAALSAPEQAILSGICVALLTLVPPFIRWRRRAWALLGLSVAAALLVQLWFTLLGNPYATRLGLSLEFLAGEAIQAPSRFDTSQGAPAAILQKFYEGLANGLPLIWSYLGASVLALIVILLLVKRGLHVWVIVTALLLFPLFTTLFFGEDPTRDLVIVGAPMILLVIVVASRTLGTWFAELPGQPRVWLDWAALVVTLLPMLYMFMYPEAPYDFLVHMLISWNNGTPIDWSGSAR